jgi:hypothetical protein
MLIDSEKRQSQILEMDNEEEEIDTSAVVAISGATIQNNNDY